MIRRSTAGPTPSRSSRPRRHALPMLLLIVALVASACNGDDPEVEPEAAPDAAPEGEGVQAPDAAGALADLEGTVLSRGPFDEDPVSADEIELTEEEEEQVRDMGATAAIVMHYGGNDWAIAQIDGLQTRFEELGIEVLSVTDANFQAERQVSDLETVMARNPDIIVSIPTDPAATASAFQRVADAGIELVFMDNVPQGLTAGEDYVSVVSADNYGNGVASAHLMAEALEGEGRVGAIYHDADFFVTQQRYDAFTTTMEEDYPDIEIVAEQGIGGPDFAGDAQGAANAMLTANPDLDAIWAVWDVPAEGVIQAAGAVGRQDLVVTTIDLGENIALSIAADGPVYGLGAQRPYDQGVAEATLAAYGLLDKEAPPYVALPALPITRENLLEGWEEVYRQDPPETIVETLEP
jgi:ribose transport system substrate-binding protein